jgi:hypothetical protein
MPFKTKVIWRESSDHLSGESLQTRALNIIPQMPFKTKALLKLNAK